MNHAPAMRRALLEPRVFPELPFEKKRDAGYFYPVPFAFQPVAMISVKYDVIHGGRTYHGTNSDTFRHSNLRHGYKHDSVTPFRSFSPAESSERSLGTAA
jgi:hypothetical protein